MSQFVSKNSTAADRRKEAPVLPARGGGHPLTQGREVHRDSRHLRPDDGAGQTQHRRREDQGLAAEGSASLRHRARVLDRTRAAAQGIGKEAADQADEGGSGCGRCQSRRTRSRRSGSGRRDAGGLGMHDYTDLVSYIIKAMGSKPEDGKVAMVEGERTNRVEVTLANDDVGKVIGRGGRNIDAIRAVVRAAALKNHDRVMVEIV